ncbi:MAG: NIPSNAP family protein [Pirellulales bacterium]
MKRREFLASSTVLGLTPWTMANAAESPAGDRTYLELRMVHVETEAQRQGFEAFAREAAVPALNRAGIKPVGVFYPEAGLSPIYVLLPHRSLDSVATLTQRLGEDADFRSRGAGFLETPVDRPAYVRVKSSLMVAFKGMPQLKIPITSPNRIFQLRIYESPSVITGQKKIEMFNDAGEIEIFRRVGLHPVFFGETIVGPNMPNLTYMLSFESQEERKANWGKFTADPDWQRLKKMNEYADKNILSKITNLFLRPAPCSQI